MTERYRSTVRVVFKHFPLPGHERAPLAAEAAMAAAEQGKFWEMQGLLLKHQDALDELSLKRYAEELGLACDRFKEMLDSGVYKADVEADVAEARRFGVHETPSFFINGRHLTGGWSDETFAKGIAEEMRAADQVLKNGAPAEQVYEDLTKDGLDKPSPAGVPGQGGD